MSIARVKTDVIDADAHVVESERVWDYLEAGAERFRPALVNVPDNPGRQHWILDGENLGPKFPSPNEKQSEEHVKRFGREVGTPLEARELSDVAQRLRHMDELGIDIQVALQLALDHATYETDGRRNRALLELESLAGGSLEARRGSPALDLRRTCANARGSGSADSLRQKSTAPWASACVLSRGIG